MECVSPCDTGSRNKETEHNERIEKEHRVMRICAEVTAEGTGPNEINQGIYAKRNAAPNGLTTKLFDDVVPANKAKIRFNTPIWASCNHAPFGLIGSFLQRAYRSP
jgi:hypothetical protein